MRKRSFFSDSKTFMRAVASLNEWSRLHEFTSEVRSTTLREDYFIYLLDLKEEKHMIVRIKSLR